MVTILERHDSKQFYGYKKDYRYIQHGHIIYYFSTPTRTEQGKVFQALGNNELR